MEELSNWIKDAYQQADEARFEIFTTEHMLLALLHYDELSRMMLDKHGTDLIGLRKDLSTYLNENVPRLHDGEGRCRFSQTFLDLVKNVRNRIKENSRFEELEGVTLIRELFNEEENYAAYFLEKNGLKKIPFFAELQLVRVEEEHSKKNWSHLEHEEEEEEDDNENPLEKYATNLNELAEKGGIDPLIGRHQELDRMIQVLSRRRKNNVVLIGEAGVGKTAIAEGLALRIVEGQVPDILKDAIIYALDLGALVAGTRYRGDFEERFKALVKQLSTLDNAVVFIDEIHMLLGAGAGSESTIDASNMLKPALAAGRFRCIGATTYKEFKQTFERNNALLRRFQKIDVQAPNKQQTVEIIQGLLPQFAEFHQVSYEDDVITVAVDMADKYIYDRQLPDKAIDLIDEAGAFVHIKKRTPAVVNKADIEQVLSQMTGIPLNTISSDDKAQLKSLVDDLKQVVFGQDAAVTALAQAIKMAHAGLKPLEKPIGAFLFTGPTGVGKTELSRQLAKTLNMNFLRFDMSEYMEAHTVSRLIGSPPGYVGYNEGGLLTDAVSKAPHSIVLLDEIEKAHPDIFNLLLQIMDYGQLTDTHGKSVNFRQTLIIMTSNVGALSQEKMQIGFNSSDANKMFQTEEAVKRAFSPEFRNRLSDIIYFKPLDKAVVYHIIDKQIAQVAELIQDRNIQLELDEAAKNWLLEHGYDAQLGARPMARLIDKEIKMPLSELILFDDLAAGGKVRVVLDKKSNHLKLNYKAKNKR